MNKNTVYTLVPSTNNGRYALDDPQHGHDLTSGEPLAIRLGGHWIEGRVEGSHVSSTRLVRGTYAAEHARTNGLPLIDGYYFIATDNFICGLCVGMKVRLP
jgi:Domain of unknown function (DUF5348)